VLAVAVLSQGINRLMPFDEKLAQRTREMLSEQGEVQSFSLRRA
jgi:hypothetical protein